jgi:hypothetical protein
MFEIERDIPPPVEPQKNARYGFERLAAGESFLVPSSMAALTTTADRVRWAVKKYRRAHAPESEWRTAVNSKGIRIWRVA